MRMRVVEWLLAVEGRLLDRGVPTLIARVRLIGRLAAWLHRRWSR